VVRGVSNKPPQSLPPKSNEARYSEPAAAAPRKSRHIAKPTVILIGSDKGGVGKTTISRAVLDYLESNNVPTRAFDSEFPHGGLQRFHPEETTIVDIASASDQMKIIDTLNTEQMNVTVIDVRAGGLIPLLRAFDDTGFLEAVKNDEVRLIIFHMLGSSIASLDEIAEAAPYVEQARYFLVKNHLNDSTFFEWDPAIHHKYFETVSTDGEITIPKLDEMTYEHVDAAGTSFSAFVANKGADGGPANHSFVLRGYLRTWQGKIAEEFERIGLREMIASDRRN
jgi:hypothetical protein